jgi:threonine dehydrogenase-like Zn-dependent dehydrogenase
VLVVGAGPIGLLAALIGVQRGLEVHVLDRVTAGLKPALVAAMGAEYHTGAIADIGLSPNIVVECTGVVTLVQEAAAAASPGGIICLTGIGPPGPSSGSASALPTEAVLKNLVMFGSVNANRRNYHRAAEVLAKADRSWLEQLITRRLRPDDVDQALTRSVDDIKVVMEFQSP